MESESSASKIKEIFAKLSDFDLKKYLPNLRSALGYLELAVRLLVMAGPLVLLGMGLWFLLAPAKEANRKIGYRTYFGMGSVTAWRFTQRLAGSIWTGVGLVLTLVMAVICNGYRDLAAMDMMTSAGKCLVWQIGLVIGSIVVIELTVALRFNRKGIRRGKSKDSGPTHRASGAPAGRKPPQPARRTPPAEVRRPPQTRREPPEVGNPRRTNEKQRSS